LQPGEVVGPAAGISGLFCGWQFAVLEVDAGAAAVGHEPDLDRAGAGRQAVGADVAPADEEPVRRVEVQEAAADRRPFDVEVEPAAGSRGGQADRAVHMMTLRPELAAIIHRYCIHGV
jgi:hypothetical protein